MKPSRWGGRASAQEGGKASEEREEHKRSGKRIKEGKSGAVALSRLASHIFFQSEWGGKKPKGRSRTRAQTFRTDSVGLCRIR